MEIAVLDIETTSKYAESGHIVEIGMVMLNTKTFQITPLMNELIKESEKIDPTAWIFQHSNLKPEEVLTKGKPLTDIRTNLQWLLDNYPVAAFNGQFDFGWLRHRKFKIQKTLGDPMLLMTPICKIRSSYGYKWPSCQEALNYWKIPDIEPHRALGDATLEARIIAELIKTKSYPGVN